MFYFPIPDDTAAGPLIRICPEAPDEGIAFAYIDGDILLDLAATTGNAKEIAWWGNPGDGSADWQRRESPMFPTWSIRTAWRLPIWTATDEPTSS
ncbi:hypothetical protein X737_15250 [Mesorhizobium sp. L48C026A00]|nr:hypothetical protein X737_15250 [Mesorhizobium sp. L48C026A00]